DLTTFPWAPPGSGRQPDTVKLSILLDADDLRLARNHTLTLDRLQGTPHRILAGRIGDQDDGRGRIGALRIVAAMHAAVALHDRLQRDLLLGEQLRDRGKRSRPIDRREADIVAALVALHRRLLACCQLRAGPAERRGTHAPRDVA